MDYKTVLRKVFDRYAVTGAKSASIRGCYETTVPSVLRKKAIAKVQVGESIKVSK